MEEKIREIREELDLEARTIKFLPGSPELTKAHNHVMLGRAWMGKMLGAMGVSSPYPNDGTREGVKDIEPAADKDTSEINLTIGSDDDIVKVVDSSREVLGSIISDIEKFSTTAGRRAEVMKESVYTHLCEARFWLGFELERIKNKQNG